ncbi:hypothetical protein QQZ08_009231 [Neonectria magnoliae]|uniref:Alcohol dehydrogenase-like C-terminal domain-containing protein n=1 Tax=Neonectria magnoliae TaxID=2732573 RepID=A0ABR1HQI7_9HYPO
MGMPDGLNFEQAATLGLGTITVGQGLYQKAMQLDLPSASPEKKKENVLIYGGGTATAALGIQFARQSGYSVVTICAPANYDYVKSLGVDLALDFQEENVGAKIRRYTSDKLRFVWDTIEIPPTAQICADALTTQSDLQPAYGAVNPSTCPRSDVKSTSTVMYTVFGKAFEFGPQHMPASTENHEFGKRFYRIAEELYAKVSTSPQQLERYRSAKQSVCAIRAW